MYVSLVAPGLVCLQCFFVFISSFIDKLFCSWREISSLISAHSHNSVGAVRVSNDTSIVASASNASGRFPYDPCDNFPIYPSVLFLFCNARVLSRNVFLGGKMGSAP